MIEAPALTAALKSGGNRYWRTLSFIIVTRGFGFLTSVSVIVMVKVARIYETRKFFGSRHPLFPSKSTDSIRKSPLAPPAKTMPSTPPDNFFVADVLFLGNYPYICLPNSFNYT